MKSRYRLFVHVALFSLIAVVSSAQVYDTANTGRITLDVEVLDNLGFDTVSKIVRLQYATASEVEPLIRSRLSRYGAVQVNDKLNMLIITDKRPKIDDLAKLVKGLDAPGMRDFLRLETESLALKHTKAAVVRPLLMSRLSSEGGIVVDVDHNALVVTDMRSRIENLRKVLDFLDAPITQVQLAVQLVEMSVSFFNQIGRTGNLDQILRGEVTNDVEYDYNWRKQKTGGTETTTKGSTTERSLNAAGQLAVNLGQLVDNHLLSTGDVKLLYSPSIITTNNKVGTFSWTDAHGYQVVLDALPAIGSEKTINLDVHVRIASPGEAGARAGEVHNSVVLKDGETFAMGGWTRTNVTETQTGNPWLGWIPLLGNLFEKEITSRQQNRVVALITPHILTDSTPSRDQLKTIKELERDIPLNH